MRRMLRKRPYKVDESYRGLSKSMPEGTDDIHLQQNKHSKQMMKQANSKSCDEDVTFFFQILNVCMFRLSSVSI